MPSQMPFDVHSQPINVLALPSSSFVERDVTSGVGKRPLHYGVYHKMGIKNLDKVLNSWTSRNVRQNIGGID